MEKMREAASAAQIAMIPGSIMVNIFLQAILNLIWGMLNDLSFLINLTMISITIPGLASSVMNIVLQFIYLDILQTDKWMTPYFTQEKDEDGNFIEDESYSQYFDQQGFQSMYTFNNLGSTLLFSFIFLALYSVYLLCKLLANIFPSIGKVGNYLEGKLFWNSTCRFIIQQFQPLLISALINLFQLNFVSVVTMLSSLFTIATIVVLVVFLWKMVRAIRCETYEEKQVSWAPLIEGINVESTAGKYWIPIILTKWTILSQTLVLLKDYPTFQMIIIGYLSLVSQILIIKGKPLASPMENKLCLFNDIMASLYLYGLYALSEPMGRNESKEACGLALLALVVFTISVNVLKLFTPATKVVSLQPTNTEPRADNTTFNISYNEQPLRTVAVLPQVMEHNGLFMREVRY
ncbi:hypothetical protein FGO68_gene10823 [Halteria grandinella]|uniref:Uncharacterized protein n=1 Tax=Halteria grandinella TaxID=5974 RepID=A0A8J8P6F5_HALGN|nr:hypothetical protein FGO68_gene10823 [Halteria grandinella]